MNFTKLLVNIGLNIVINFSTESYIMVGMKIMSIMVKIPEMVLSQN